MAVKKHRCAAIGCAKLVNGSMLMCGPHWAKVPAPIRSRVYRTYSARMRGVEGAEEHHRFACLEAIKAVGRPQEQTQERNHKEKRDGENLH